jgi:hypothetical protein
MKGRALSTFSHPERSVAKLKDQLPENYRSTRFTLNNPKRLIQPIRPKKIGKISRPIGRLSQIDQIKKADRVGFGRSVSDLFL